MNDIDDDLQSLYRAARAAEEPSAIDRALVQAAVSATVLTASVTAAAATAAPAVKGLTLATVLSSLAIGAVMGVGASATVLLSRAALSPAPQRSSEQVGVAGARALMAPKPVVAAESLPPALNAWNTPGVSPPPPAESTAANIPRASAVRATGAGASGAGAATTSASAAGSRLARESQGIAAIQSALANGAATRALELLAAQEAEFRDGELAEERAAVRVLALCAAGSVALGQQARERFLRKYPQSPLTGRVLNSCAKR